MALDESAKGGAVTALCGQYLRCLC
ncbi:uncharacterized protein METZ01_LOCUS222045 [marine metagenome]|uniref:Uncharacterized protein n=1 Tax=marine metagenome TaxID=408172 RepID=A0A382G4U5_9ZZZZ